MVEHIQRPKSYFISELAADDGVSIGGRWVCADGLVKAIPPTKAVTVSDASNKSRSFLISVRITKVRRLPGKYQIILHSYLLRWGIERCFEEAKDFCYLDHYQVRRISRIKRRLSLAVLDHTFSYAAGDCAFFKKHQQYFRVSSKSSSLPNLS